MPRGYNLEIMNIDRLHDLLEYENKDPNLFILDAIKYHRIDLLPLLFDYGINLNVLLNDRSIEEFLGTCSKEVENYLSHYFQPKNSSDNSLSTVLDELDHHYFQNRFMATRYATYNSIDKIGVWSIGLIDKEARNLLFLESLNLICDVGPWEDRFVNVDLEKGNKFLVTTIKHIGLNKVTPAQLSDVSDVEFLSPNISHLFKVYLVNQYEFKSFLANFFWEGTEKMHGISYAEKDCLFNDNGSIDSKIYDLMKNEICRRPNK